MKTALITGILGQDGRYLANFLLSLNYKVVGVSRNIDTPIGVSLQDRTPNLRLYRASICDSGDILKILNLEKPDELYNLAGFSSVKDSWKFPAESEYANSTGFFNLMDAVRRHEALMGRSIRIYQASSSEIFGNAKSSPQNELTEFSPTSPYGHSKLAAHLAAENFRNNEGMFVSTGILFNHESPLRSPEFVTRKITMAAAKIAQGNNHRISLGNLHARRDWGFAGDYVIGMWKMLQVPNPDSFVLATGISTSVQEFITMAFGQVGIHDWENYVELDQDEQRPKEPYLLVGDATKANEVLEWYPKVSLAELITMMIKSDFDSPRS